MIYFIRSYNEHIKIGTSVQVDKRQKVLQTANPKKLHVVALLEGSFQTESGLHELFSKFRIRNSEWFKYSEEIKWFIRAIKENQDVNNIHTLYNKSIQMRLMAKAKRLKNKKLHNRIERICGV